MKVPGKAQRPWRQRLLICLGVALAVQILVLLAVAFWGGQTKRISDSEAAKLETPVASQAAAMKRLLHSFALNAGAAGTKVADALSGAGTDALSLLENALPALLDLLEHSGATGMFLVLGDSPADPGPRQALYLRDTLPDLTDFTYSDILCHRGPSDLAKAYGIPVDSMWWSTLRESSAALPFYVNPLLALSQMPEGTPSSLGFWSPLFRMTGNDTPVMTYSLPLLDSGGNCLGVFGIELSASLLQTKLAAAQLPYARGVFLLCEENADGLISPQDGMFSGAYSDVLLRGSETLALLPAGISGHNLYIARFGNGCEMLACIQTISLYDGDDFYNGRTWQVMGLVPQDDFFATARHTQNILFLLLSISILCSALGMLLISRSISRPLGVLADNISSLRNGDESPRASTNIAELDELLELLYEPPAPSGQDLPPDLFNEFIERTRTLTYTERLIFDHYISGKSAKEVTEVMFISINTLKVHNKHIYQKLNISSREELLLYIELLRKSKKLSEIQP